MTNIVYTEQEKQHIRDSYRMRYPIPTETPQTHPWLYDPCEPPPGWSYDMYYDVWIKHDL
jgi:hypothetical protein